MEERECSGGFMATSLQKAARSGDVDSLVASLECTATNLDAVDAEGHTALMIAAANGHTALVTALCDAGADTSATDGDGHTAEQIAANAGHAACAARLHKEAGRRASIWAAINGGASGGDGAPSSQAPRMEDMMAKLLAEAGLPKGPAESPF